MSVKESTPKEPLGTLTESCNILILGIRRIILKISPHCWKRNEEFQSSKKVKMKQNLDHYLLDKQVIKDFVQQINDEKIRKEGIKPDWPTWKYYGYEPVVDKRNDMTYRIIFFLDDNNPESIGVITVYPCE